MLLSHRENGQRGTSVQNILGENIVHRGIACFTRIVIGFGVAAFATMGVLTAPSQRVAYAAEPTQPYATTSGVLSGTGQYLYDDGTNRIIGTETVLPGQRYLALNGIANPVANTAASGLTASVTWNPKDQQLDAAPSLRLLPSDGTLTQAFSAPEQLAAAPVESVQYRLEYTDFAFPDSASRKSLDSFDPANGITWVGNPDELPGGIASVSSVRVRYHAPLPPGATIGVVTPLQRTASAVTAGTALPWYFQYADSTGTVLSRYVGKGEASDGGAVRASDGLIRANAEWRLRDGSAAGTRTVAATNVASIRISPRVLGPTTGASGHLDDATVRISLPNGCFEPVMSALPPNVTVEAAGPGSNCLTKTPAALTVAYGTLEAPSGAPSAAARQQLHITELPEITTDIPIHVSDTHPERAIYATVTAQSPSDSSWANYDWLSGLDANQIVPLQVNQEDRTELAKITIGQEDPVQRPATNCAVEVRVSRDLDRDGQLTAADPAWQGDSGRVELSQGDRVMRKSSIAADGTASFTLLSPGKYAMTWAGKTAPAAWASPHTVHVNCDAGKVTEAQLLVREVVPSPELQADTLNVVPGESRTLAVTTNDLLPQPTTPGSRQADRAVQLLPGQSQYGVATFVDNLLEYTAMPGWPPVFVGADTYQDTVSYAWTNIDGVTSVATVYILVHRNGPTGEVTTVQRNLTAALNAEAIYLDIDGMLAGSQVRRVGDFVTLRQGASTSPFNLNARGFLRVVHAPGSRAPLDFSVLVTDEHGDPVLQVFSLRFVGDPVGSTS